MQRPPKPPRSSAPSPSLSPSPSPSPSPSQSGDALTANAHGENQGAEQLDRFVREHFHFAATWRLHRSALGWDLLRAPINVVLAPFFLLTALLGMAARLAKLPRVQTWLNARRVLLKTSVARALEAEIAQELLQGIDLNQRSKALIADYTGTRSAVAEITTSVLVLLCGFALFGTATLGVASLTPAVSGYVGYVTAISDFPLGSKLGTVWYGVFPTALPVWTVLVIGVALAMVASIVTTFAGVIADPIQARLGIHRWRLAKLVDTIAESEGKTSDLTSDLAPEHILARFADITDAGLSLLRFLRS